MKYERGNPGWTPVTSAERRVPSIDGSRKSGTGSGRATGAEVARHSQEPPGPRVPISATCGVPGAGASRKRNRRSTGSGPPASTASGLDSGRNRHSVGPGVAPGPDGGSSQPSSRVLGSHPVNHTAPAETSWTASSPTGGSSRRPGASEGTSPSSRIAGIGGSPAGISAGAKVSESKGVTQGGAGGRRAASTSCRGAWSEDRTPVETGPGGGRPRPDRRADALGFRVETIRGAGTCAANRRTKTNRSGAAAPRPTRADTGRRTIPRNARRSRPQRPGTGCGRGSGPNRGLALGLRPERGAGLRRGAGELPAGFSASRWDGVRGAFFMGGSGGGPTWVPSGRHPQIGIQPLPAQPFCPTDRGAAVGGAPMRGSHQSLQQTGHPSPGALGVDRSGPKAQAAVGASSAVMSITAGSSSGTSTSGLTLMLRCRSKPVPAGMMWPMMTFSLKPRR
jgi:hypothetical protein